MNFKERLWAPVALYLACALVIPAVLLVFAPISWALGAAIGVALYAITVIFLIISAPLISVTDTSFRAGSAEIERRFIGQAEAFTDEQARLERGQRLDLRAWLVIRGWIKPVVKVTLNDPLDPTPYWLVSSRHPHRLTAALGSNERSEQAAGKQ